jgi:light-harvesting complex 1 beta chain
MGAGVPLLPAVPVARDGRDKGRKAVSESKLMAVTPGGPSITGLSEAEAKEFHGIFITSFIVFTVIAIIAHFLAWQWRPWLPGPNGYATSWLYDAPSWAAHTISQLV